jgi:hypothetical protein
MNNINVTGWDLPMLVQGAYAVSRPLSVDEVALKRPDNKLTRRQAEELVDRWSEDKALAIDLEFLMGRSLRLKVKRVRNSDQLEMVNNFEPKELSDLLDFTGHDVPAPRKSDIARNAVKSSTINSIGYDKTTATLAVQFTNGTVYEYAKFSGDDWQGLITAKSVGAHFGKSIKGKFVTDRMADEPPMKSDHDGR